MAKGKGKAPVPLDKTPTAGRQFPRKAKEQSAVKRETLSPAGEGSSVLKRRFRPNSVQRAASGTRGVSARGEQEDVKAMLAAVREERQASPDEVVVLSSQQPPGRSQPSQSSQPIESNGVDHTSEIILTAPRGKRSARPKGSPNVDAT